MTEYLIDGPDKFMELIKEIGLEDPDIETLKTFCSARKTACCSGSRGDASRGIEAIYKKIIFMLRKKLLIYLKSTTFIYLLVIYIEINIDDFDEFMACTHPITEK